MQPLTIGVLISDRDLLAEAQQSLRELPVRILFEQAGVGEWGAFQEKLERLRPDVLLIDLALVWNDLEETVRKIKATVSAPVIIGLHRSTDAETILRAIRSGAGEYLYPPIQQGLNAALERISAERSRLAGGRVQGRTVAFLSAKGGCGATTIACHVAAYAARLTRQQVLLADFDLENGLVGFLMRAKSNYSLSDALGNVNRLDLSFWKALVSNGIPGLEIIPAPASAISRFPSEHDRLRQILLFVRAHYDWTFVDLGRGLSSNTLGALEETDEAYLVTTIDVPALYRAKNIIRTLRESGYSGNKIHVLLNRVPRKTEVTADDIQQLLDNPIRMAIPDEHNELADACAQGVLAPHNSHLGQSLTRFTAQVCGLSTDKPKAKFAFFKS